MSVGRLDVLVILASLPFAYLLLFRPVLRRLAVRNAVRRPRETALVLLGSMLGTAILTGSFVVGDTLEASLRHAAYDALGPIDEIVTTDDVARSRQVAERLDGFTHPDVDGVLAMQILSPVAIQTTTTPRRASARSQLFEVDFEEGRRFGGDAKVTGLEANTPTEGRASVTSTLADDLALESGDTIEVYVFGKTVPFVIDQVLEPEGVAGFSLGLGQVSNVFVAKGTIDKLVPASGPGSGRGGTVVAISNKGDVETGVTRSARVSKAVEAAVAMDQVDVRQVKKDVLDGAEAAGRQFSTLFTAMGSFGVIAGILLLVNIFVMLAEERRSELGMIRALGMRRSSLVGAFSLEGWLYALAAAAIGSVVGIGLGRLIGVAAAGIFSGGFTGAEFDLVFAAKAASIKRGFTLGFLIALGTVVGTSVRISRFNVIQAIRELNEAPAPRTRNRAAIAGVAGVGAGALWGFFAFTGENAFGSLFAPMIVIGSLIPLVGRVLPRRPVTTVAAALGLVWGVFGLRFFRESAGDASIMLFVGQGVILTASAVALVSVNQDVIGAVLRRAGGGSRSLALRLGLAYPLARRFRTGMTLAMYTLVIFTLTFITVFSYIIQGQVQAFAEESAGEFDVIVRSNPTNPVDPAKIAREKGVVGVSALYTTNADFTIGTRKGVGSQVSSFDRSWVDLDPPALTDKGSYKADDAAYRAVLADPGLIIVNRAFGLQRQGPGPPRRPITIGQTLTMVNTVTLQERPVKVAAISSPGITGTGALYGLDGGRAFFTDRLVPNPVFVATRDVDNDRLSTELTAKYIQNGVEADSVRKLIADAQGTQLQFFGLLRGYLALGLLVGIAGLGVIMIRAVRERRRQIGVLRALGFEAPTVRRSFVLESGFVALEGTLIGVALAIVNAWTLVVTSREFGEGLDFRLPGAALAVLVGGTLVASLIATAWPSQAASRIRPAVALRITD